MGLGFDIGNILQQYGNINPQQPPDRLERDFDDIAQHSPNEDLEHGVNAAFRSDQTPPFGEMVGQLFSRADSQQRSGMLSQLLGALGPSVIGSMLGGGMGGGGSGGGLGGLLRQASMQQDMNIRPEDADRLSPEEVKELAARAERENPGIIDQMSRFSAQNPGLVKALGGAALAIALGQMAQRRR